MPKRFNWLIGALLIWSCAYARETPKILVALTVQNDEEAIWRCLESVKEEADYLYVADRGSTDKTIEWIEQFLEENKIPGMVEDCREDSFSESREKAISSLRKIVKEMKFAPSSAYFLFLEPSMTVSFKSEWKKEALTKDAYSIWTKEPHLGHSRYALNLLKGSLFWKPSGVILDEWTADRFEAEKLEAVSLDHSVAKKEERLKREIKVLKEALKKNPDDLKSLFLLAQAYKSIGQFPEAIHQYRARIEKKGDSEELWFSKYMLGQALEEYGEWTEALYWYLEAFQMNPLRGEPLNRLSHYYRLRGENDLAYLFASHGANLPKYGQGVLFDEVPFDPYQLNEDLSIAAFYTRFKAEGFEAAERVLLSKATPWHIKDHTYRNILFYTQNLGGAVYLPIKPPLPPIEEGSDEHYRPMNPSIVRTETGYQLICRSVNYTQTGAKIFNTNDSRGIFRTRNFLIDYDMNFNILSQKEIVEDLPREKIYSCSLEGLEDCRLFEFDGSRWFTCTTADTNPTGNRQISLCRLEKNPSGEIAPVEDLIPLIGPDLNRCEKNWLPFVLDGRLFIVYSCGPFQLFEPDLDTGVCRSVLSNDYDFDFSRFRGSAAPIRFDGGFLMLVHETVHFYDHTRCYLHRFVFLDSQFRIEKISKPFTFQHQGVEFCCSMTLDAAGEKLILPIGIEDREAYLCLINTDAVRNLLEPLPNE